MLIACDYGWRKCLPGRCWSVRHVGMDEREGQEAEVEARVADLTNEMRVEHDQDLKEMNLSGEQEVTYMRMNAVQDVIEFCVILDEELTYIWAIGDKEMGDMSMNEDEEAMGAITVNSGEEMNDMSVNDG